MVTVVGIGPGHPDYITPAAARCIKKANVLIGGRRVLSSVDVEGKDIHYITSDIESAVKVVRENADRKVAVVVGGDPGFYSILKTIRNRLPELNIKVIPGISPVQLLFSMIGCEWQDVTLVSVHGRPVNELKEAIVRNRKVCVLTDERLTAPEVCKYLKGLGMAGRAVVGKNLSYPDQEIIDATVNEVAGMAGLGSSVLYVEQV